MLKWLLADPDTDVRIRGPLGTTALHCAAKYTNTATTSAASATAVSGTASGAAAASAVHEGAEMCALLLKAGVPVDAIERCSSGSTGEGQCATSVSTIP
jgi:hypothetical protein